jgi:hypothetical protein
MLDIPGLEIETRGISIRTRAAIAGMLTHPCGKKQRRSKDGAHSFMLLPALA